jgi:hypothetical protein
MAVIFCGLFVLRTTPAIALTQDELDANRDLWSVNGSQDYDYVLEPRSFLTGRPGQVEVRAGTITSVTDIVSQQPLDLTRYQTVDDLFELLQNEINRPAFTIEAEFDSTFGYPTMASIDPSEMVIDEEFGFIARDLTLVPEPSSIALMVAAMIVISMRWPRPSNLA